MIESSDKKERIYTFHMTWAVYDYIIQLLVEAPWRIANPILQDLNAQRIKQDEIYAKAQEEVGKNAKTPSK